MEALYRKYRPITFADVVGQEHIERTLKNAIEQDKVSHAYLFCGPRGTGKTTMARILAKALLCAQGPTVNPDGHCEECKAIAQGTHPDVYELDAASRTGVENVREEIISRVHYAPTRGSWKVYIVDEVHMLSPAAFNALLKTLEEPPAHVVFIMCTTDPQKVPETIQSRCQRFDFHRIAAESMVSRLGAICMEEGVEFEGEALDLIAHRAEGGMRNALTALEQLIAFGDGHVTLEGAQNLLGSLDETDLSEIVLAIGRRDVASCFNWVARYVETGADLAQFVGDLAEYIRHLYLLSMVGVEVEIPVSEATRNAMADQLRWYGEDRLSRLLLVLGDLMKELRVSSNPRLSFEIALTRMVRPDSDMTIEALAERVEALESGALLRGPVVAVPQNASSVEPVRGTSQGSSPVELANAASRDGSPVESARAASQSIPPIEPARVPSRDVFVPTDTLSSSGISETHASHAPAEDTGGERAAASVDLSNPAALQRLWRATTTTLRKTNPARGVLFMNAKVSAESDGQGIVVEFSPENTFAYNAAQKKEVRELLTQTLRATAGGDVPYRLAIAGTAAPSIPEGSAVPPLSSPVRPMEKRATIAESVPVSAAPSFSPSPQPAKVVAPETVPPQSVQPAPVVEPVSSVPLQGTPSSFDDDQVPLDVYDAVAPGDVSYEPAEPSVSVSSFEPALASVPDANRAEYRSTQPVSVSQPSDVPYSGGHEAASSNQVPSDNQASDDGQIPDGMQIKDILTASFGEGIKFEELPE